MSYKLFLDDFRIPAMCTHYMLRRIGFQNTIYLDIDWVIVKNYDEFVDYIKVNGLPTLISFDHDLSDEHYSGEVDASTWDDYYLLEDREMTGYDCAKWLVDYCDKTNNQLPLYVVHSMNLVGTQNIIRYLENYKKSLNG